MNPKKLLFYILILTVLLIQLSNVIRTTNDQKVTLEALQNLETIEGYIKKGVMKVNDTGTVEFADGSILNCGDATIRLGNNTSYLAFSEMKLEPIKSIIMTDENSVLQYYKTKNLYYLTVTFSKQRKEFTEVYVLEEGA